MMKCFIGVCCAMLLCLSACGDIDSPEFPPSAVRLNDIKALTDLSYSELGDLNSLIGINFAYDDTQKYLLSGNPVLNSPYESCSYIEFCISPDKSCLSEKYLLNYGYNYENVYHVNPEYVHDDNSFAIYNLDAMNWDTGTYYYCLVAYSHSWGNGPGILDDCLQQDYRHATISEIKSFTVSSKYIPYAEYSLSGYQEMHARFSWNYYMNEVSRIGVCYSYTNQLPTTGDQSYTAEADYAEFSFPFIYQEQGGTCYIRPFVVTKNNVTIYGYTNKLQY